MSCYRSTFSVKEGFAGLEVHSDILPRVYIRQDPETDEIKLELKAPDAMCLHSVSVYPAPGLRVSLVKVEMNGAPLLPGVKSKSGLVLKRGDSVEQTFRLWNPELN